jgi:glycosyl hydrolase family 43
MRRYLRAGLGALSLLVTVAGGSLAMGAISASPAGATVAMGTTSGGEVTPVSGTHQAYTIKATDFPDPDVVYSGSGSTYYAYGTGTTNVVAADWTKGGIGFTKLSCSTSGCSDQSDRTVARTTAALPRSLDATYGLQAPSVAYLGGQWVMYYGGVYANPGTGAYAVYYSTSPSGSPTSNFTNSLTEAPLIAQTSYGGSTDPSVFIRPTGQPWLTWKSSTYRTDHDKADLWSMRLTTVGTAMKPGASSYVLATQPTGGWANTTIENPQMVWSGGTYYLFYSGGLWTTDTYAEGYTTCSGPTGGCGTPNTHRILSKYTAGLYGPGGGSLFTTTTGTWLMAFHSWNTSCTSYFSSCNGYRDLYVRPVDGLFSTSLPNLTSFTASSYTVGYGGGTVILTAHATRAVSYTFISSPGPTGIPAFVNTTSGTATATVHVPANTSSSPVHYTFTVYATGPYGGQVSKGLGVTVINHPVLGSFTASLASLATTGGPVTLVATGTGGTSYTFSANQPVLGLPVTVSSSTGSAHVSVIVPPNYLWTTDRVTFSASLTGTPAATTGLTVAAMQSQPTTLARFADGSTGSEYAVRSPTNSLDFYYESDGGSWVESTIPGATAYSTPALTRFSNGSGSGTEIAFEGPSNSLKFAYQVDGKTWSVQTVTGALAYSAPSLTRISTGTLITFEGPSHSLKFAYQTDGGGWNVQTVTGASAYSAPSIARFSDGGNGTEIAFEGPSNSLKFAYQTDATPSWKVQTVTGASAYSAPSLARFSNGGNGTEIAFEGPSNSLKFAYQTDGGGWSVQTVTGALAYSAPSLTRISTGTLITFEGPSNSLKFAYQTDGGGWNVQTVTGGSVYAAPSISRFSNSGGTGTEIAFQGPSNSLKFAYQTDATPHWRVQTL